MSNPQGGYPPQGYPAQGETEHLETAQYDQSQQPGFDGQAPQPPQPVGGKKKRAYAGQAFEFGAGANAATAGQQPPLTAFPGATQPAQYGIYPQQPAYGDQGPPALPGQPGYGQAPYGPTGVGYQPPEASYPAPGANTMMGGGVSGVTQQFSQMGMGGGQQAQQPQAAPGVQQRLNPLIPTDLTAHPFNVAELDMPPPPIILPPNASVTPSPDANCPPKYAFDWDTAQQKSIDRWQRPELNYAVCEFIAPQEYMVRPPQPLVYLFLFDVSYASVTSGLLATSARCILESLDRIPNADRRTRLGFMAVDSSLHYFSIPRDGSGSGESRMLVVSDLDEPFLPTPEDLLVNLAECKENIETFLSKLQSMFQNTQNGGSCMGSALRAGHKLISPVGGKITVLTAVLPNMGYGKLEVREDKKILGTSKESSLLQTANGFYKSFAVECSKNQVSIDMFLFSSQYQDVASLSNLPRYTGGQTYFYPAWNAARTEDAIKFATEFSDYLSSEIGLEAVLRVRATTGLRMSTFYGNFFNRSSDLCAFPAFPRDQAYVVEVAIDETITKAFVCMQAAVLHTTCNGERRIRVMTLSLPTTQNLADVYASADQQAIVAYFSHKAVERALGSGLDAARDALQAKIVELLQTYKKELAGGNMGGGGLQFPQNLRGLPVLFLGLMKNLGLRKSAQIPSDLRSAALCLLSTLPLPLMMQYIYPRLYSLHDMPDNAGIPDANTGDIALPPPCNLSSERLVPYGLYLIDDGQTQFLWVGRDAVPALIQDVFGVADKTMLKQGKATLPVIENEFNERVRAVVEKSRDHRAKGVGSIVVPPLYIIREDGEPSLRLWALTLLVEDRADQGVSLGQWMGVLREKVSG
ncbi:Protein transport protein SEC24 [Cryomyces minteri]|nr:Protein transport protein SEC24 [Cryomyces minteri]